MGAFGGSVSRKVEPGGAGNSGAVYIFRFDVIHQLFNANGFPHSRGLHSPGRRAWREYRGHHNR